MFQTVIAVLIGMSFLYFVLAVLCSGVKEYIAAKLNLRASTLEQAIGRMLDDAQQSGPDKLKEEFYSHPLIQGLAQEGKTPSYIPAQYFSTVLEAVLKARKIEGTDLPAMVRNLPEGKLKQQLSAIAARAGNETAVLRAEIERWFDTTMDRVSGWYKRQAQKIVLGVAFALVFAMNADSCAVFRALWQNSALRDSVVAAAGQAKQDMQASEAIQKLDQLPLGWNAAAVKGYGPLDWLIKLSGLLLTAFATTLGAPFWFDAMNKLVNLRLNGSPPEPVAAPRPAGAQTPQAGAAAAAGV